MEIVFYVKQLNFNIITRRRHCAHESLIDKILRIQRLQFQQTLTYQPVKDQEINQNHIECFKIEKIVCKKEFSSFV